MRNGHRRATTDSFLCDVTVTNKPQVIYLGANLQKEVQHNALFDYVWRYFTGESGGQQNEGCEPGANQQSGSGPVVLTGAQPLSWRDLKRYVVRVVLGFRGEVQRGTRAVSPAPINRAAWGMLL